MSPSVWELVSLGIAIFCTSVLLALSHWIPLTGKLARLSAYKWGTILLWAGFAGWRLANGDWQTPAGAALIYLGGGLAVIGAYRWDKFIKKHKKNAHKVKMIEATDDTLKKS